MMKKSVPLAAIVFSAVCAYASPEAVRSAGENFFPPGGLVWPSPAEAQGPAAPSPGAHKVAEEYLPVNTGLPTPVPGQFEFLGPEQETLEDANSDLGAWAGSFSMAGLKVVDRRVLRNEATGKYAYSIVYTGGLAKLFKSPLYATSREAGERMLQVSAMVEEIVPQFAVCPVRLTDGSGFKYYIYYKVSSALPEKERADFRRFTSVSTGVTAEGKLAILAAFEAAQLAVADTETVISDAEERLLVHYAARARDGRETSSAVYATESEAGLAATARAAELGKEGRIIADKAVKGNSEGFTYSLAWLTANN
ncbi:MAG TPA: hypothetical protein DCZ92_00605 [Elusimicrobia bacterium]|nr:MAG: hypothetical protein A2016_09910 [Elusimicrobia bacterium GWF2_62_30]HBA59326.1 hypothetical protein [Elusimicrobiota bacterium]